jgi:hypothetical protein
MAKTDGKKKSAKPMPKKANAGNNKKIPKEPPKTPIWK